MKRKHLKQHVFNSETDLCMYCGTDLQEGQLPCDYAPDSAPDYFDYDDPRWQEEEGLLPPAKDKRPKQSST